MATSEELRKKAKERQSRFDSNYRTVRTTLNENARAEEEAFKQQKMAQANRIRSDANSGAFRKYGVMTENEWSKSNDNYANSNLAKLGVDLNDEQVSYLGTNMAKDYNQYAKDTMPMAYEYRDRAAMYDVGDYNKAKKKYDAESKFAFRHFSAPQAPDDTKYNAAREYLKSRGYTDNQIEQNAGYWKSSVDAGTRHISPITEESKSAIEANKRAIEANRIARYNSFDDETKRLLADTYEGDTASDGLPSFWSKLSGYYDNEDVENERSSSVNKGKKARQELRMRGLTDDEISYYSIINERKTNEALANKEIEQYEQMGKDHPVLASALSVPMSVATGVASFPGTLQSLNDSWRLNGTGYSVPGVDTNSASYTPYRINQALRQGTESNIDTNGGKFVYETFMSGLDSVANGLTGAAWLTLGANAAVDTATDITDRGGTTSQAILGGLAAGIAEGFFEEVSISKLKAFTDLEKISIRTAKDFAMKLLGTTVTNFSEEAATEAANIVFDYLIAGDISNWHISIENYMSQGMTEKEAQKQTIKDFAMQVGMAGAGGALMGAGFGVGGAGVNIALQGIAGRTISQNSAVNAGELSAIIQQRNAEAGTPISLAEADAQAKTIADYRNGKTVSNEAISGILNNKIAYDVMQNTGRYSSQTGINNYLNQLSEAEEGTEYNKLGNKLQNKLNENGRLNPFDAYQSYSLAQDYAQERANKSRVKHSAQEISEAVKTAAEKTNLSESNLQDINEAIRKSEAGEELTSSDVSALNSSVGIEATGNLMSDNEREANKQIHNNAYEAFVGERTGESAKINSPVIDKTNGSESAEIVKFKEISQNNATVELSNGNTANLSRDSLSFENASDQKLWEGAKNIASTYNLSADKANYIIQSYSNNLGMSVDSYLAAVGETIGAGASGLDLTSVFNSPDSYSMRFSARQRESFVNIGKSLREIGKASQNEDFRARMTKVADTVLARQKLNGALKGKVSFNGHEITDSEMARIGLTDEQIDTVNYIKVIAEAAGTEITTIKSYKEGNEYFYNDQIGNKKKITWNGFTSENGGIVVDLNAERNGQNIMLYTMSHELVHEIAYKSPADFNKLADFIVAQKNKRGEATSMYEAIRRNALRNGTTFSVELEEYVAQSLQDAFTDKNQTVLNRLAVQNPEIHGKIASAVNKFANKIREIYSRVKKLGLSTEGTFLDDIGAEADRLREMFADSIIHAKEVENGKIYNEARAVSFKSNARAVDVSSTDAANQMVDSSDISVEQTESGSILSPADIIKEGKAQIKTDEVPEVKQIFTVTSSGKSVKLLTENGKISKTTVRELRNKATREFFETSEEFDKTCKEKGLDKEKEINKRIKNLDKTFDQTKKWLRNVMNDYSFRFVGLQDCENQDVIVSYDAEGNPTGILLSAMVNNGDYQVNIDLTKVCARREALQRIVNDLTKMSEDRSTSDTEVRVNLTAENIDIINRALAEEGIDTACLICFVESKRYNVESLYQEKFIDVWNKEVRKQCKKLGIKADYFRMSNRNITENGNPLSANEILNIENRIAEWRKEFGVTDESESKAESNGNVDEKKVEKLMRSYVEKAAKDYANGKATGESNELRLLTKADLLTEEGSSSLKRMHPNITKLLSQRLGTSAPKAVDVYTPYNGEIELLQGSSRSTVTKDIKAYLKSIGGVRSQSFSDFMGMHLFDVLQKTAAMSARGFTAHTYTKEIYRAVLFGMCNEKINLSAVFEVKDDVSSWNAGLRKADDGSFEFSWADYNAVKNGKADFVQSVRIHSSDNVIGAIELQKMAGYSKNCGIIGVGHSWNHIMKMQSDPDIRMIIGYHRSSLPVIISNLSHLSKSSDYTSVQNTLEYGGIKRIAYNTPEGVPSYATPPSDVKEYDEFGNKRRHKLDSLTAKLESNERFATRQDLIDEFNKNLAEILKNNPDYTQEQAETEAGLETLKALLTYANDNNLSFQTKKADDNDAKGHEIEIKRNTAGSKNKEIVDSFHLYEDLENTKDPYLTAQRYIAKCIKHGLLPEFYEFTHRFNKNGELEYDVNYYKHIYDFNVVDRAANIGEDGRFRYDDGSVAYAPQEAVNIFNEDGSVVFDSPEWIAAAEATMRDANLRRGVAIGKEKKIIDKVIQRTNDNANAGTGAPILQEYTYDKDGNLKKKNTLYDIATGNASIIDLAKGKAQLKEVDPVQPTTDEWKRSKTTSEVKKMYPELWDVSAEESDEKNPTQVSITVSTYRKIYDILKSEGFSGTILDASSGMGLGTKAGRDEYGFNVEDIEPYPGSGYNPMYKDYSKLSKTYDAIISNAVLNVIPQDQRDALVVKMGEMLNPGGQMFINVRGSDVLNASSKMPVSNDPLEVYISDSGSYQKGFTNKELTAYLKDALGEGFTVESTRKFGKVSAIVTKNYNDDIRYQQKDSEYLELAKDSVKNETKIAVGMSDIERYEILKDTVIEVEEYQGEANNIIADNKTELTAKSKKLVKSALIKTGEYFNIFKSYNNDSYDIEISVSRGTLKESASKRISNAAQIVKLMPKIDAAIKNAVGIEAHSNRYFFDYNTVQFLEMVGGYIDGDLFVPVRFGIKQSNNQNTLYVIIDEEGIKKTKVIKSVLTDKLRSTDSRLAYISIADVLRNVNNKDFLRFVPDGFLNEKQITAKHKAIAETIKSTNDKNDKRYKEYLSKGDMRSISRMVKLAAKAGGFIEEAFHGSKRFGWTKPNTNNSRLGTALFVSDSYANAGEYAYSGWNEEGDSEARTIASAHNYKPLKYDASAKEILNAIKALKNNELGSKYNNAREVPASTLIEANRDDINEIIDSINKFTSYWSENTISKHLGKKDIIEDALQSNDIQKWEKLYNARSELYIYIDAYQVDNQWGDIVGKAISLAQKIVGGGIELENGNVVPVSEALKEYNDVAYADGKGVYRFYAKPGKQYVYNGVFNNFDSLKIPSEAAEWIKENYGDEKVTDTDTLAAWAKSQGYDSIKFYNIYDNVTSSSNDGAANVTAFFYPESQIKSADPVTYDDNGNIIPLSERFNSANDDIRYQSRIDETRNQERDLTPDIDANVIRQLTAANKELTKELGKEKVTAEKLIARAESKAQKQKEKYESKLNDMKKLVKLQGTVNAYSRGSLDSIATQLINYTGAENVNKDKLIDKLQRFYSWMTESDGNVEKALNKASKDIGNFVSTSNDASPEGIAKTIAARDDIGKMTIDLFWNAEPVKNVAGKYQSEIGALKQKNKYTFDELRNAKNERIQNERLAADFYYSRKIHEMKIANENKVSELKREQREKKLKAREEATSKELKTRIAKTILNLGKALVAPTEKNYIPKSLQQTVAAVIDNIDMTEPDKVWKTGERAGENYRSIQQRNNMFNNIREAYRELQKSAPIVYDPTIMEMMDNFFGTFDEENNIYVRDKAVFDMNNEELGQLLTILKATEHSVKRSIKMRVEGQLYDAYDFASKMIDETKSIKKKKKGILSLYINENLNARSMFNRLGGYTPRSYWLKASKVLDDAQLKKTSIHVAGQDIFKELLSPKHAKELYNFQHELVDIGLVDDDNKPVLISRGMMLSVYMNLLNEDNVRHMAGGAFTVPDINAYYKGKADAWGTGITKVKGINNELHDLSVDIIKIDEQLKKLKETRNDAEVEELNKKKSALIARRTELADNERQKLIGEDNSMKSRIESMMTDYEKKWIEKAQYFFDEFSRGYLNEATNEMYGFEKAKVKNYFPIHVDRNFRGATFDNISYNFSVENMGMMKDRVVSSKPIMLEDITDVIFDQLRNVSMYSAIAPAVKDMNRIFNITKAGSSETVMGAVNSTVEGGERYIKMLMADLQEANRSDLDFITKALNKTRGALAQATLTLNPRVTLVQAASYPTAASEIGYKPLAKALLNGGKNGRPISKADRELIAKYSPLLAYRLEGNSQIELGNLAESVRPGSAAYILRKTSAASNWIQAMDAATVGRLWYACEYYVDDNNPDFEKGTEDYYKAVADVFNRVVEKTQPNYTVMQRPQVLREKSSLLKFFTMFMTQRMQNFNILYDSVAQFTSQARSLKNNEEGITESDVKQSRDQMVRAISSQAAAAVVLSAMKIGVDFLMHNLKPYKDDDDDVTAESVLSKLLSYFLESEASCALFGSELYTFLSTQITGEKYYGLEIQGISTIQDILDDFSKLIQSEEFDGNKAYRLAKDITIACGIPAGNVEKIVKMFSGWATDISNGGKFGDDTSIFKTNNTARNHYIDRYIEEYISGDKESASEYLSRAKEIEVYTSSGDETTFVSSYRTKVHEALKDGTITLSQAIELLKHEMSGEEVMKTIKRWKQ